MFDFNGGDIVTIALVEEAEAFTSFFVFAGLLAASLELTEGNHFLDECEIDTVASAEVLINLAELVISVTNTDRVVAKILHDVTEVLDRDVAGVLLVVKVKGILQVVDQVGRHLTYVALVGVSHCTVHLWCFRHLWFAWTTFKYNYIQRPNDSN